MQNVLRKDHCSLAYEGIWLNVLGPDDPILSKIHMPIVYAPQFSKIKYCA